MLRPSLVAGGGAAARSHRQLGWPRRRRKTVAEKLANFELRDHPVWYATASLTIGWFLSAYLIPLPPDYEQKRLERAAAGEVARKKPSVVATTKAPAQLNSTSTSMLTKLRRRVRLLVTKTYKLMRFFMLPVFGASIILFAYDARKSALMPQTWTVEPADSPMEPDEPAEPHGHDDGPS
jgi:hypothetical protein